MNITLLPQSLAGDPESTAMLQAFYSRSHMPIAERLQETGTDSEKVKQALNKYYVGYGHASIGQCGTVTLFIEGVSMLAAKALQHHPLYNGQECSTRYLEFNSENAQGLQKTAYELYEKVMRAFMTQANVTASHKALQAWAFDRARAWLPCGTLTNLSVTMNMTAMREHFEFLAAHPLQEVREIALKVQDVLTQAYPFAFSNWRNRKEPYKVRDCYRFDPPHSNKSQTYPTVSPDIYEWEGERGHGWLLSRKSRHDPIPEHVKAYLAEYVVSIYGQLDYGSWRELQRHRLCAQVPCLPAPGSGFFQPYIDSLHAHLPASLATEIEYATKDYMQQASDSGGMAPYNLPLGTTVSYVTRMPLHQAVYLVELRTAPTVHFCLRQAMHELARDLKNQFIPCFPHDPSPDVPSEQRANQTIRVKEQ